MTSVSTTITRNQQHHKTSISQLTSTKPISNTFTITTVPAKTHNSQLTITTTRSNSVWQFTIPRNNHPQQTTISTNHVHNKVQLRFEGSLVRKLRFHNFNLQLLEEVSYKMRFERSLMNESVCHAKTERPFRNVLELMKFQWFCVVFPQIEFATEMSRDGLFNAQVGLHTSYRYMFFLHCNLQVFNLENFRPGLPGTV